MPVDAHDVGGRVVVRSLAGGAGPGGGPVTTDVVGVLVAADAQVLQVRRRDGSIARVAVADVVAAKRLPAVPGGRPGRGLRIAAEQLQAVTDAGWPAPVTEPLGDWLLRAAGGFTGRANSASVHGDPGVPPEQALAAVVDFYARHRLPAMAQVVVGGDWDDRFTAAGWVTKPGSHDGAVVQVAAVRSALKQAGASPDVTLGADLDDDWLALYNRAADLDPAVARAVLAGPEQVVLARVGTPAVAIGRLVVTGDWAGMAAVEVEPAHRRRGLARQVVDALLEEAARRGARWCYLQTMEHNGAALELYARYGFVTHHRYRYVVPPQPGGAEQMTVSAGV
jgi:ribosomal protein S18 acetylase RimI-like enzyme